VSSEDIVLVPLVWRNCSRALPMSRHLLPGVASFLILCQARPLCPSPSRLVSRARRAILWANRHNALPLLACEGLADGFAQE
jgi:hypothetical protein